MANYRMTIQYDGTRYSGWQSQHATDATIQGKLETVLTRMTGQQVDVIGSGRTDAGVHAIGRLPIFILSSRAIRGAAGWIEPLPSRGYCRKQPDRGGRAVSQPLSGSVQNLPLPDSYGRGARMFLRAGMCMITGFRLMWKGCGRRRDFFWGSMILSRSAAIQE